MADLFDNTKKPQAPTAKPPGWVVLELVNVHKCHQPTVKKWHARQAFAVLYQMREKKRTAAERSAGNRARLVKALAEAIAADDSIPQEFHDLINEGLANLDRTELVELARLLSALLVPPGG